MDIQWAIGMETRWWWRGPTSTIGLGFDDDGHPHSADMRLEERYHRVNHDTIEVTMTIIDPKAYTKPWVTQKLTLTWAPADLDERVCVPSEEEKYRKLVRDPAGGAGDPNN